MATGIYKRIIGVNCGKGINPSNKGKHWKVSKKRTPEMKEKCRQITLNRWKNLDYRKQMSEVHKGQKNAKGKKWSLESREKLSKSTKGRIPWNKNKKCPEISGENNYHWIKDRTLLKTYGDSEERRSPKYKYWSKSVKDRDNWKCRINNKDCKGKVVAHHILSFTDYPELRYDINNGITLCQAHHPRKRAEEKRLIHLFNGLVAVLEV